MQLLILLAVLLLSGKGGENILSEVKPVLESLGGEEIQNVFKSAQDISQVLTAVKASPPPPVSHEVNSSPKLGFPLSPVSDIADKEITYCLSKYISEN